MKDLFIIISVILSAVILYGIYCVIRPSRISVIGKVISIRNQGIFIGFNYNSRYYTVIVETNRKYVIGQSVKIFFLDNNNPEKITLDYIPSREDGFLIISLCSLLLLFIWSLEKSQGSSE